MGVGSGETTEFINCIQLIYNNCAKWYVVLNRSDLLIINKQILLIYYINSLFYTLVSKRNPLLFIIVKTD